MDSINKIVMNLTCQVNNDIEDFIVRSVQEYGMNETVVVNAKKIYEALEKQIPKKVVRVKLRPTEWGSGVYCPVCESEQTQTVFFTDDGTEPDEKTTWCSQCGQKLDWSE